MTAKVDEMWFVSFHQLCRCHLGALLPDEVHLGMNRAQGQPGFKNQQHAAVKKKARSADSDYYRYQVVTRHAWDNSDEPDSDAGGYKHAGRKVKGHHCPLQYPGA